MGSVWIDKRPDPALKHKCAPPMRDVMVRPPTMWPDGEQIDNTEPAKIGEDPAAPVGSVWMCECGQAWVVRYDNGVRVGGYVPAHNYWSHAGWFTVWRAKRRARRGQ